MKRIVLVALPIGVLVVGLLTYWLAFYEATPEEVPIIEVPAEPTPVQVTYVGTVTDVNFEKVAVGGPSLLTFIAAGTEGVHTVAIPSVTLPACTASSSIADPYQVALGDMIEVRGLVDVTNQIVPCSVPEHYLRVSRTEEKAELGLAFTYKKGPNGYVLEEDTLESGDKDLTLLYSGVFTNTKTYAAFVNSTEAIESPEHFQIRVYENDGELPPSQWLSVYPEEAGVPRMVGEAVETEVVGERAVRYTTDGLYPTDTYVVARGSFLYLFEGSFNDPQSLIAKDFTEFVSAVRFVAASTFSR